MAEQFARTPMNIEELGSETSEDWFGVARKREGLLIDVSTLKNSFESEWSLVFLLFLNEDIVTKL